MSLKETIVFGSGELLIMEFVPSQIFSDLVTGVHTQAIELY